MSLRVWLPLTKDLRQQGLSDTTITNNGATFNSAGKLGGCYNLNNSVGIGATNITLGNTFSIACWIKVNSYNSDWANAFKIYKDSYDYIGLCMNQTSASTKQLGFHIYKNNGSNARTGVCDAYYMPLTVGVWYHLCFVVTPSEVKTYQNGANIRTGGITTTFPSVSNYNLGLGKSSLFGGLDCSMNDFRLYNHALSQMEVKELSKGLVLHYPLNRGGWGQENLVTNSSSEWSAWYTPSVNGTNQTSSPGTATLPASKNVGDIYSCSVEIEFSGVSVGSDGTFAFRAQGSSTSGWVGGNPWSKLFFSGTVPVNGVYRYNWTGSITSASVNDTTFSCGFRADYWGGGKYRVRLIKMEPGEISTPWCPHSTQAMYTTMGLNGTTEYDCSGYGNNGTRTGTFTWSSDTPKYQVSTHIGSTSSKIHISDFPTSGFGNTYSFAWWGKRNSNSPMFWGFSNGIRLNGMYAGTLWNTGDSSDNPIYKPNTTTTITAPSLNVWHHYVMTGDGSACKLYVDGELYGQAKTYKAISGTSIYINGWDSSTLYCSYNTDMSDFRIYATALSASDVKSLYQNSAYIDSSGNVYGAVHEEG